MYMYTCMLIYIYICVLYIQTYNCIYVHIYIFLYIYFYSYLHIYLCGHIYNVYKSIYCYQYVGESKYVSEKKWGGGIDMYDVILMDYMMPGMYICIYVYSCLYIYVYRNMFVDTCIY
jgi:hypothetical protein